MTLHVFSIKTIACIYPTHSLRWLKKFLLKSPQYQPWLWNLQTLEMTELSTHITSDAVQSSNSCRSTGLIPPAFAYLVYFNSG